MTVTVQRETSKSKEPGDTDIGVANKLLQFARELWDEEPVQARKNYFLALSERFWDKVQEMTGREDIYWFDSIRSTREMEYECDSKLDGPAVVDCAKLEYQGFVDGTVKFTKGETKYFKPRYHHFNYGSSFDSEAHANAGQLDTCGLAVSANKPMTLTWDQISTAFNTLFNLCIDGPFFTAKGGHALFSAHPQEIFGRKRRKGKRDDRVSGTNALPQGSRMDLWKHGGNGAKLDCEFKAVLLGQDLNQCATS